MLRERLSAVSVLENGPLPDVHRHSSSFPETERWSITHHFGQSDGNVADTATVGTVVAPCLRIDDTRANDAKHIAKRALQSKRM